MNKPKFKYYVVIGDRIYEFDDEDEAIKRSQEVKGQKVKIYCYLEK